MAAKLEKYCAPGVYNTSSYSQAIKVTGAQTNTLANVQVASLSHPDCMIEVEAVAVI